MAKPKREPFHHVQLTADERFSGALRTQMEMERLASGRATWPAAMLPLALMEIEMRTGAELAARIEALSPGSAPRTR